MLVNYRENGMTKVSFKIKSNCFYDRIYLLHFEFHTSKISQYVSLRDFVLAPKMVSKQ